VVRRAPWKAGRSCCRARSFQTTGKSLAQQKVRTNTRLRPQNPGISSPTKAEEIVNARQKTFRSRMSGEPDHRRSKGVIARPCDPQKVGRRLNGPGQIKRVVVGVTYALSAHPLTLPVNGKSTPGPVARHEAPKLFANTHKPAPANAGLDSFTKVLRQEISARARPGALGTPTEQNIPANVSKPLCSRSRDTRDSRRLVRPLTRCGSPAPDP
jgi:hypothetical protein